MRWAEEEEGDRRGVRATLSRMFVMVVWEREIFRGLKLMACVVRETQRKMVEARTMRLNSQE
jgi:hypothetical protein